MKDVVVKRKLTWFSKHEGSDTVSIEVCTLVEIDGAEVSKSYANEYCSDVELTALAGGNWNEDTICAARGIARGIQG